MSHVAVIQGTSVVMTAMVWRRGGRSQLLSNAEQILWGWDAVWEALPWGAGRNDAELSLPWAVLGQKGRMYRFWVPSKNHLVMEFLLLENIPPSNQVQLVGFFFLFMEMQLYVYHMWRAIVWYRDRADNVVRIDFTQRMWRHAKRYRFSRAKQLEMHLTLHLRTREFTSK